MPRRLAAVLLLLLVVGRHPAFAQTNGCAPACACPPVCCPAATDDGGAPLRLRADYLLWWVKNGPLNAPLLTRGSLADPVPGAVGQPGTRVLFGDRGLDYGTFSGLSLSLEAPLSAAFGVQAGFFFLEQRAEGVRASSDAAGNPVLAHPFTDALTGSPTALLVSFPAAGANFAGSTAIRSTTRLSGYELNGVLNAAGDRDFRLGLLVGFRALDLNEDLSVRDRLLPIAPFNLNLGPALVNPPAVIDTFDRFKSANQFYGGQVGARGEYRFDTLSVALYGKVALGTTQQLTVISGASSATGLPALPGGTYAQVSNIGRHYRSRFGVVPEAGFTAGYDLAENLRASVGYTFLYWSGVARPGRAVNGTINPNLIPTDPSFAPASPVRQPSFQAHDSDFWAQGVTFGLELRY